uniref:Cyclin-T1-5 n=1 Tax=Rhizophora mucronata TaxID=61149 RepID=A0A2P2LR09_RHIMU
MICSRGYIPYKNQFVFTNGIKKSIIAKSLFRWEETKQDRQISALKFNAFPPFSFFYFFYSWGVLTFLASIFAYKNE